MRRNVFKRRFWYFVVITLLAFILSETNTFAEVIIDNGDSGTSYTGSWTPSSGSGYYGSNSLFARPDATYTWQFDSQPPGEYEVLMWWTSVETRGSSISVDIVTADGIVSTIIDQTVNGGQWNSLGIYRFDGTGGRVSITASGEVLSDGRTASTCADAVRFVENIPDFKFDTDGTNVSSTGLWRPSSGSNSYGEPSLYARPEATFTWDFNAAPPGNYEVLLWWTTVSTRGSFIPVEIVTADGIVSTTVDQTENGGQWNSLGTYRFDGTGGRVTITASGELLPDGTIASTCADAVRFVLDNTNLPPNASITSIIPNPANNGEMITFAGGGSDPEDGDVFVCSWNSNIDGPLSNEMSFSKSDLSEGIHEISFRVQDSDESWSAPATLTLIVGTPPPNAIIDSMTPNPASINTSVAFGGHGETAVGSITGFLWTSSIDGELSTEASFSTSSLSAGTHTISFTVYNNATPSLPVTQQLVVEVPDIKFDTVGTNVSSTGLWRQSGGNNSFGAPSLYARPEATFTWDFNAPLPGYYEVLLWWTTVSTRGSFIPVEIVTADGIVSTTVDQTENGGQWNSLGTYRFDGTGGRVTITASGELLPDGTIASTCADAVRFVLDNTNLPPNASITSIIPNPANNGEMITFAGGGSDPEDGDVFVCSWNSNIDGPLSNEMSFSKSDLSEGIHEISFRVQDSDESWSAPATLTLIVGTPPPNAIIDSMTPNPASINTSVAFGGHGETAVGSITGFLWTSSIDGELSTEASFSTSSLSAGTHTISFTVYNNATPSLPVTQQLVVEVPDIKFDTVGTNVSSTGLWRQSGGNNSFGAPSLYARPEATFTWDFNAPLPGYYEVLLWWTTTITRGSFIPVEIVTAEGIISTTVDQTVNGGQWNSLGTYRFDGTGGRVTITASGELLPDGTTASTCADAVRFQYVSASNNTPENIYVVNAYGTTSYVWETIVTMLEGLGATEDSGVWHYYSPDKDATYFIREVKTLQGYKQALKEEGSHVIYSGHSNYGLGATFAMTPYQREQIRFFNDDLFLIYGTDMVDPDPNGMKFGQPYPNWEPVYKNGQSAIMPYDFGDPRGLPPYNYYLTYTLPGDPVHYKIELADGSPIERFPDSGVQAWYASDGSKPDPIANPEYFIIAPGDDYNKCDFTGDWAYDAPGDWHDGIDYMGYNYQYHSPGTGTNKATFTLVVKSPGLYAVIASWYPDPSNASNATYTIQHADMGAGEYSTVVVDQRESELMNMLGVYYYNEGTYTIEITDNADGRVIADAVLMQPIDGPQSVFRAEFSADSTEGTSPHTVQFIDGSTVYISGNFTPEVTWYWDFGDGETSESQSPTHTYTVPGTYDISFTITMTDEFGNITHTDTEVKEDFMVVDSDEILHAEFTAQGLMGQEKTVIAFHDQSSGNITSWHWDFGDGTESIEQNPIHEYTTIGSFTVTLTVFGPDGGDSESEVDFVYNTTSMVVVDNTFHIKPHYYRNYSGAVLGSVIMDASPVTMQSEEFKFSRLFINACYTYQYFTEKFSRGVVFYTLGGREEDKSPTDVYLREYLLGKSDDEILRKMNEQHYIHGYYDFNELPPSMH